MAVNIDISTFPAEGGQFTIQLTKEDNYGWFVTTPTAAWIANVQMESITNHLYEMRLEIEENTNVADRTVSDIFDISSSVFSMSGTPAADTVSNFTTYLFNGRPK